MLEQLPLPGVPEHERDRRKRWMEIPHKALVAIRKMHHEWQRVPNAVLTSPTGVH